MFDLGSTRAESSFPWSSWKRPSESPSCGVEMNQELRSDGILCTLPGSQAMSGTVREGGWPRLSSYRHVAQKFS